MTSKKSKASKTSKVQAEEDKDSMTLEEKPTLTNDKKGPPFSTDFPLIFINNLEVSKFKKFTFPAGTYDLEIKPTEDKLLDEVMKKRVMLQKLINEKTSKEKNAEVLKIADYKIIPMLEFFIRHHHSKQTNMTEERCSICIFEFCDDVDKLTFDELVNDLKEDKIDDIIQLEKCDGHFFHLGCIQSYLTSQKADYIKCPICCFIYGVMTGNFSFSS